MTIGQLATESGLPASTIRYWEKVGVFPQVPRIGGQRRYTEAVHRLPILGYSVLRLLAADPGISTSEIARRTLITQQAGSRLIARMVDSGILCAELQMVEPFRY